MTLTRVLVLVLLGVTSTTGIEKIQLAASNKHNFHFVIRVPRFLSLIPFLRSLLPMPLSRLLDLADKSGQMLITKAIHGFLQLQNQNVKAVPTFSVADKLLGKRNTAHSTFKILITLPQFDSYNVPAGS